MYDIKALSSNKRRIFGEQFNKRCGANSHKLGTFPYALCKYTFTNNLLVNDKIIIIIIIIIIITTIIKKPVSLKKYFTVYFC